MFNSIFPKIVVDAWSETFQLGRIEGDYAEMKKNMKTKAKSPFPSFVCSTRFEQDLVFKIAERAVSMAQDFGADYDMTTACMDIAGCHLNGCELDLNKLLAAPDGDFGHDVFGIRRHINRSTAKLEDCFLPRCAMPQPVTA